MSDSALRSVAFVVLAFGLFYLLSQPSDSADLTRRTLGKAEDGGNQLVTFVETLTSHKDATAGNR